MCWGRYWGWDWGLRRGWRALICKVFGGQRVERNDGIWGLAARGAEG